MKIGDIVKLNRKCDHLKEGMTGIIIYTQNTTIGVAFDDWKDGHNCNGEISDCSGYYVPENFLFVVSEPEFSIF